MKTNFYLAACLLPQLLLAAGPPRNPEVCDLNVGESCTVKLQDGREKAVKLLGFKEITEPYFAFGANSFVDYVIAADVHISVGAKESTIKGGPFRMPVSVDGVNILVNATKAWVSLGGQPVIRKDVRLELADASLPFYDPGRFVFPIKNYRWRVMNYQHTWMGIAVNQAKLYIHAGEDMGMIPDREDVLAITDGVVKTVPGPNGDNASNAVYIEDPSGLSFRISHMNTPNIRPDLQPGVAVKKGEKLGLTGNTWQGKPVTDPHLHVSAATSNRTGRHSFPIIVNAYLNSFPGSVLPVAGGWRHLWAGSGVELDASQSIASPGRKIVSYDWTFTDGSRATGPKVQRSYSKIGTYSEQLRVRDDKGTTDSDFVEVFVLDRENKKSPPFAWIGYYPIRGIKPDAPVEFRTYFWFMDKNTVQIDFGDGTKQPVEFGKSFTHKYAKPGVYLISLTGADAGSGPGTFHSRLIVE